MVLDGVDAPAYPRTLVDRCVPISVSRGAAVTRELHAEFLGATFDVLSRRMVRREAFDPAWLPGPLAGFAAHGQAVAEVLGFESSCFDEALCEQLAIRDRLAADSAQPPW